MQNCIS